MEIHPSSVVSMISRNEMPSMPSTYPAPMEGIQLLGAPSMNLNPGSKRCAQNHGTSGMETIKPAREKMFAIQRMACLFSLGTKMSRIAPTSGVNKMIERIWLCISFHMQRRRPGGCRWASSPTSVGNMPPAQPTPVPALPTQRQAKYATNPTSPTTITSAYHCTNPHCSMRIGYDSALDRIAGPFTHTPSMIHLSHHEESVPENRVIHPAPLTVPSITCESTHQEASPSPITPRRTSPTFRRPVNA